MSNWKVDLIQELSKICSEHRMRDHRAFIFWYIKATEDLPNEDVNERITDRGRDAGSDAVHIDYNTKTIKIIQSKYTPNIGQSPFNKDEGCIPNCRFKQLLTGSISVLGLYPIYHLIWYSEVLTHIAALFADFVKKGSFTVKYSSYYYFLVSQDAKNQQLFF